MKNCCIGVKQQSLTHFIIRHLIILIPSQTVFALLSLMLNGEATNTNFIVFGLTRPELKLTIYHTRDEHANHYATDGVVIGWNLDS
jgi:hypothetical protein